MADSGSSWVRYPQHPVWNFNYPDRNLLKLVIDLRSKWQLESYPLQQISPGQSFTPFVRAREQTSTRSPGQLSTPRNVPELFRKENQRPGSFNDKNIRPFGGGTAPSAYYGGPIIEKETSSWRATNYTRANGDVIGAKESGFLLPENASQITKSVAVMSGSTMTQSALWIGPRLLLSTLHVHNWVQGFPSEEECKLIHESGVTFKVETEISSQVLGDLSPKVRLRIWSVENDLGIFELPPQYPAQSQYISIDWLMERDEVCNSNWSPGRRAACIGYNGSLSDDLAKQVQHEASRELSKKFPCGFKEILGKL